MKRHVIMYWTALALWGFSWFCPFVARADDEDGTASDTEIEAQAIWLRQQGQNAAAETLYQKLLNHHPNSSVTLISHIGTLDALGRFPEALTESKRAVAIDPENFAAQRWLGISLCRVAQYQQAIPVLEKSIQLDSYENPASLWLANAYFKIGKHDQGEQILEALLQGQDKERQIQTMDRIASLFYEINDSSSALLWWKRSAALGSKSAAQWLSWAYSTGYGVPQDVGDSSYWSRIGDDPFPWFPRLFFANDLVNWAHGWGLVLIIFLYAMLLPVLTLGIVGYGLGWGLTTDPSIHWTDRARRSYPFQIFLGFCLIILPILYAASSDYYPSFALPISKQLLFWVVLSVGLIASNLMVVRLARRYRDNPDSAMQNFQNIFGTLFLYGTLLGIFVIMANNLPDQWNLRAVLVIAAALFAYLWIQFGGWIKLGRFLRLLVPADGDIVEDAATLAQRWSRPSPTIWMFRWRKANALAFPFSNAIVVTEKLRTTLTRDEMNAVLAHELAHLCEDQTTRFMRLFTPLLLLPLFTISLWMPSIGWSGLIGCYAIIFLGFFVLRKRSRRMEERADTFGKEAEKEAGVYPQALAKLYEANLVPAVMPGKRKVHPHLYDRLLAAGITPDYPRPKPPARWGVFAALFTVLINVICLVAIWLLLF